MMELCGAFGAGSSRSGAAPFDRCVRSVGWCGCQRCRVVARCMNLLSGERQVGVREGVGVDIDAGGTVLKVRGGCGVTVIGPQAAVTGPEARSRER